MNCEMFLRIANKTGICQISKLREAINSLNSSYDDYEENREEKLIDLIMESLSIDNWAGSADEYHNFSVWFATRPAPDYVFACQIVKKGLEQYQKSVDLLADFLQYGSKCSNEAEKCEECFKTLNSISREKWNWRAYSFSIDYLLARFEKGNGEELDEHVMAMELANAFIDAYPRDERSYVAKGDLLRDGSDEKMKIYQTGCEMSGKAPRCSLHLAEIYFENKEYQKMLNILEQCQEYALEMQNSVNIGYIYILTVLCRLAILYRQNPHIIESTPEVEEQVKQIHIDFKSAKIYEKSSDRIRDLEKQIDVLTEKTGIPFDSDY